jgi:hypothetical protein
MGYFISTADQYPDCGKYDMLEKPQGGSKKPAADHSPFVMNLSGLSVNDVINFFNG